MANLPSLHPAQSLHLTDRSLNPILSSSRTHSQLDALTALAQTSLSAYDAAQRLGLGSPVRILVEHADNGPVFLQSFMRPQVTAETQHHHNNLHHQQQPQHGQAIGTANGNGSGHTIAGAQAAAQHRQPPQQQQQRQHHDGGFPASLQQHPLVQVDPDSQDEDDGEYDDEEEDMSSPPLLVGIVVAASSDETMAARRAAARLERVGRSVQAQWAADAAAQPEQQQQQPHSSRGDDTPI